jgi:pimeloyl-ACP methyl ester carboxylesterase
MGHGWSGMNKVETLVAERKNLLAAFAGRKPPAPEWFKAAIANAPERTFLDVRGAAIETLTWGQRGKPGVLFLHGNGANAEWWSFIAPFLSDDYRVAALSFSGMGGSGWRDRYSYDGYVSEALEVAEVAGLFDGDSAPVIVGHSFGAFITSGVVARGGARLGGAMLLDGPFLASGERKKRREKRGAPRPKNIYDTLEQALARFRFAPDQDCENLFIADWIARSSLREYRRRDGRIGWTWRFDPHVWTGFMHGYADKDLRAGRCPIAVIGGARSGFVANKFIYELAPHIPPKSPMIVIPDSDHHIMADQPLALVDAIRTQLANWR